MKTLTLLLALIFSLSAFTCTEDGTGGIVEENNMRIPVSAFRKAGLTREQFNAVIDKIEPVYAQIVSSMGGKLEIERKWDDATVNANASRKGKTWHVNMYGGLARHSAITEDGFALVLCHEIGHHLGGAPKSAGILGMNRWASNEGQADYYANLKCLRKIFLNDDNAAIVKGLNAPEALVKACEKAHRGDDMNICIRGGMAGMSVASLFADLRQKPIPSFLTPDSSVVSKTNDAHPAYQCRLDTYFQGSLCEVGMNEEVDQKDEVKGTCHNKLGHSTGVRPLCWFKPKS